MNVNTMRAGGFFSKLFGRHSAGAPQPAGPATYSTRGRELANQYSRHGHSVDERLETLLDVFQGIVDDPQCTRTEKALAQYGLSLRPEARPRETGGTSETKESIARECSAAARGAVAEALQRAPEASSLEQALAMAARQAEKRDYFCPAWIEEAGLKAICRYGDPGGQHAEVAQLGMDMGNRRLSPERLRGIPYDAALIELSKPTSDDQGERLARVARHSMPTLYEENYYGRDEFRKWGQQGLKAIVDSPFTSQQQKSEARGGRGQGGMDTYNTLLDIGGYA